MNTAIVNAGHSGNSIGRIIRRFVAGFGRAVTTTSEGRMNRAAGKVLTSHFPESDYVKQKRAEAIQRLGTKWVHHSNYKPTPRHSNDRAIWWPNRSLKYAS